MVSPRGRAAPAAGPGLFREQQQPVHRLVVRLAPAPRPWTGVAAATTAAQLGAVAGRHGEPAERGDTALIGVPGGVEVGVLLGQTGLVVGPGADELASGDLRRGSKAQVTCSGTGSCAEACSIPMGWGACPRWPAAAWPHR